MRDWTIGSDPEIFLHTADNKFFSAYDSLGSVVHGTKTAPEVTDYGGIQVDGMALEINTNPTSDPNEFSDLIEQGLSDIRKRFPEHLVSTESVQRLTLEFLGMQPEQAIVMGCESDFNPYQQGAPFAAPPAEATIRTAGGHIHIGWTKDTVPHSGPHMDMCMQAAQQLDVAVGLWCIPRDAQGYERQKLYGLAGAFRPKPYGIEYRVPSNFWIFDPYRRIEIAQRALVAMEMLANGTVLYGRTVAPYHLIGKEGSIRYFTGDYNAKFKKQYHQIDEQIETERRKIYGVA